jgi:hypothetical protein
MSSFDAIRPKQIQGFKVYLMSGFNTKAQDISGNIASLNIYENIHTPYLSADVTIMDDSNILSEFPIVGQEIIEVQILFRDTEIIKDFHVIEVTDVGPVNDNAGGYKLKLVSHKAFTNATQTFSRAYNGRNTDIVANIHEDFFDERPEIISEGATSHNIIIPYTKPLAAIDTLLKTTAGADGSPLFLWETLLDNKTYLASLNDLLFEDAIVVHNVNSVNRDPDGQGTRNTSEVSTSVDDQVFKRGFPTFKNLNDGNFAANLTTIDIGNKTYQQEVYDFKTNTEQGDLFCIDYLSNDFKFNERTLDQIPEAANLFYKRNTRAYQSAEVGLLNNQPSLYKASRRAYRNMMNNNAILIGMDGSSQLTAGRLVDLHFKRFKPNLDSAEDIDPVNSGQYLCSAIKHTFKGQTYSMTIEAVRSGINYEVEL